MVVIGENNSMTDNNLAPISLFVYNRLEETKQTIEALKQNFLASESELFIFSDGPKNEVAIEKVENVRSYIKSITGFKSIEVFESDENKGLANSIIQGVSKIIKKYGKIIVLEDDLITTPNFLNFMNQALAFYKKDVNIYTINGYSPLIENIEEMNDKVYFHSRTCSWGWATWCDRWDENIFNKRQIKEYLEVNTGILEKFKKENGNDVERMLLGTLTGENDSWYIRWVFHNFLNNKQSVFPVLSKIVNIGFNVNATHCDGISAYVSRLDRYLDKTFNFENNISLNNNDYRFLRYFSKKYKFFFRIKLLRNSIGRRMLLEELKLKFFSNKNSN